MRLIYFHSYTKNDDKKLFLDMSKKYHKAVSNYHKKPPKLSQNIFLNKVKTKVKIRFINSIPM